ncbi:rhodanese-like domain-containing protein [Streptococcus thoraltensis]|uniref:rhodanese-like domain-containing protein n=1 Tax=Streptococcus thoraltensis TaxID=55085 RepID=UPI00037CBE1F|nr:rhodanese-like domain-containing protein [Streptococcus thoraltensis]MDY4762304.1 rhodanese-like domain-containing protein [Streptococcus thoraltensis]
MTVKDDIVNGQAVLIDVRSSEEFSEKHIKGARNIPVELIEKGQLDLTKNQKIYLHCQLGSRADRAQEALKAAGYTDVHNLKTLEAVESLGLESEFLE